MTLDFADFLDLAVIALYFVLVVGAGVWFQRRAARGLDAYFLGGKNIPGSPCRSRAPPRCST